MYINELSNFFIGPLKTIVSQVLAKTLEYNIRVFKKKDYELIDEYGLSTTPGVLHLAKAIKTEIAKNPKTIFHFEEFDSTSNEVRNLVANLMKVIRKLINEINYLLLFSGNVL